MKKICLILMLSFCWMASGGGAHAEIEEHLLSTIKLSGPVKDMDVTEDGEKICVLDDKGNVVIYNRLGDLLYAFGAGENIGRIKFGPSNDLFLGNELFLYDTSTSVIKILDMLYVHDIDISGSPHEGPVDAPVTVVVFSDFQCPYCAKVANFMKEIVNRHPKEVKYVFMQYPLTSHKFAPYAARASYAAQDQGKFWEFHDLLFNNYNRLNKEIIEEIRSALQLEKEAFEKKMNSPETDKKIKSDKEQGIAIGVTGTPAVFVNGKKVKRNNFSAIQFAIQAELDKKPKLD